MSSYSNSALTRSKSSWLAKAASSSPSKPLFYLYHGSLPCLMLLNLLVLTGLCGLDILTEMGHHISMNQKWLIIMIITLTFNSSIFLLEMHADKRYRKVKGILRTKAILAETEKQNSEKMIAILSHEMRNPMQTIVGITQQLQQTSLGQQQREYLQEFEQSGQHMLALLEDLLSSNTSKQEYRVKNAVFTFKEIIQPLKISYQNRCSQKQIKFIINTTFDDDQKWVGDQHKLRQILMNLCENAVKYTSKGIIALNIKIAKNGEIIFDVRDTGCGIQADKQQRIFDEFTRFSDKDNLPGSIGLGLAVARRLAHCMNGSLQLQSNSSKGCCFRLKIPLKNLQKDIINTPDALPIANTVQIKNQCILLVDDDKLQSRLLGDMISTTKYKTFASNGAEALQCYFKHSYDVILMDLNMPVLDGFEAARQVRNWEKTRQLKPALIIALSAAGDNEPQKNIEDAGFDHWIKKPVDITTLNQLLATAKQQNTFQAQLS